MKKLRFFLIAAFMLNVFFIYGQNLDIQSFNTRRIETNRKAMLILGGWALGNMAVSGIKVGNTEGVSKGFHQMNIGWNAFNFSLAAFGYYAALKENPASIDGFNTINEHYKLQKIFLLNTGLDVAYVAGGAWLMERSKTAKKPEQMKGFGQAVIMNGAFLFVFDIGNYLIHNAQNDKIRMLLKGNEVGLSWHF